MNGLLVTLSEDPRAGLAPGFDDAGAGHLEPGAGEQSWASLPDSSTRRTPANAAATRMWQDEKEQDGERRRERRGGRHPGCWMTISDYGATRMLSFSNTDMAFRDDVLVVGSYHGFNVYQLLTDGTPEHKASIVCPGGQGDVSIVGDLLIMSVEETRGRLDCGLEGVTEDDSPDRFRGLRIFDISDLTRPRQVGAVQTCRGSHTHSVVSGPDRLGRIVVYNSGTAGVREADEMEGCIDECPGMSVRPCSAST